MIQRLARLIFAILLLVGAPAALAEPRLALLISNQSYTSAIGPLRNPRNDIALIKAALLKVGFAEAEIFVVSDADRVTMLEAFEAHAARVGRAGPDAVSFFYYSGHGAASEQRENYLIPVDVPELSVAGFWHRSVKLRDLLDLLNALAPTAKHFVVFDACRNTLRLKAPASKALALPKGFLPVRDIPGGMLIAFSTAEGELASDDGDGAGPYAPALAGEIVKPGVEALTVFRNAQLKVRTAIRQDPWMQHSAMGEVYFAGREAAIAGASAPAMPPALMSEAAQAWAEIGEQREIAIFEAFRKQYGGHALYDALAAKRIEELKRRQPIAVNAPIPAGPQRDQACDGPMVSVTFGKKPCIEPGSGVSFRDCPDCPEMVVVPNGNFTMILTENEPGRESMESSQTRVSIAKPFAVGKFAVTFDEWDACINDGGCNGYKPSDAGWNRGKHPVINVSWDDAQAYVSWLSSKTGKAYRLPSEAEREYVTRAGTTTPFWWGTSITPDKANYDGTSVYGAFRQRTVLVDTFKPNPWGLYNVHGNVWEWTADCWNDSYKGNADDGSARETGDCGHHVVRGGSWFAGPEHLRSAFRYRNLTGNRGSVQGFRLARNL